MQVSVLVPEPPARPVGVIEQVSPDAGRTLVVSATASMKPLTGIIVIVELVETPGVVVVIPGLANVWKSTTCTKTVTKCDNEPLVAMTVTT